MTGKRRAPDNPVEWLLRARSSLSLACVKTEGVLYEDLCYQVQQAAEKALKEDLHDLAMVAERRDKGSLTFAELKKRVM